MSQESKQVDPAKDLDPGKGKAPAEANPTNKAGSESDEDEVDNAVGQGGEGASSKKKKKKSKKKTKQTGTEVAGGNAASDTMKAIGGLSPQQITELMAFNPALLNELRAESSGSSSDPAKLAEAVKKLNLKDILTGMATSGKNVKEMGAFKFWATQPVPQFGENPQLFEEGPLRIQKVEDIPTEPEKLAVEGFRWVVMDLTNDDELTEVEKLLYGHYVEDDEAMFRFKYSKSILRWSLMPPGWKKQWHIGIRSGNTLCAFISAIPVELRVRENTLHSSEVNFLCIHKKLRGKRLAPVLIKEITRVCNLEGVWQAIYTGGVVLPRPVSTARYFHRSLDWKKLNEVNFCQLPSGSTEGIQIRKYRLPEDTSTRGLREMQTKDLDAVQDLLDRYFKRFDLTPLFNKEEMDHWFLDPGNKDGEKVIWSYVVEDDNGKITDFFSFYCLESSVIRSPKHSAVRAAYLFYYATETGLTTPVDKSALKKRLNELMHDALILAKRYNFDVFNALSLMDNALFLEQQKFGPGDGQLHYYLFNYKANPIAGGVDMRNRLDEERLSGVGLVML